jgi:hypothetical protein
MAQGSGESCLRSIRARQEAEMERFGEKSYFNRKMNGLSLADSDDGPDLIGDDVHGHGFEELGEEPEEEAMEVDTGEA